VLQLLEPLLAPAGPPPAAVVAAAPAGAGAPPAAPGPAMASAAAAMTCELPDVAELSIEGRCGELMGR
jgi:hypothetical protein